MEFSGRLASFPIAELLTWATNDRRTGSLMLQRSSREKRIYFRQGKVVACLTGSTTEYYGQHLLLEGYIEREPLFRCLMACQNEGKLLGGVLVERGVLELELVQRTLREQIEDLVCDVFLWQRGIFFFQADRPPEEDILAQPINTLGLVLEGSRWVDEMRLLRRTIAHDNLYLRYGASGGQPAANPSPRAAAILRKLGDRMTVEELYQAVGGSYFRFLSTAAELVEAKILQVLDEGQAEPKATAELPLSYLLREQAAEEQLPRALGGPAIPLHLLERYRPVWVRQPDAAEWEGWTEVEKAFLDRIDGRRRLKDILSQAAEARNRETEMLLLQISREMLAFVPPADDEGDVDLSTFTPAADGRES